MEGILHHLGCKIPCDQWDILPYQLVQDFFHQQYGLEKRTNLEDTGIILLSLAKYIYI